MRVVIAASTERTHHQSASPACPRVPQTSLRYLRLSFTLPDNDKPKSETKHSAGPQVGRIALGRPEDTGGASRMGQLKLVRRRFPPGEARPAGERSG